MPGQVQFAMRCITFLSKCPPQLLMTKNEHGVLCAALAYILIGIIWYFVDEQQRKDAFVRFHVRQAVALLIVGLIVAVVHGVLYWIPFIGWLLSVAISIGMLILWLIGIIGALTGKQNPIPIVASIAKNFKF